MSPAPARTTDAAVIAAARQLLESGGLDHLTMQAIADRVGVRAPSLYKRFASRADLLRAVAEDALRELGAAIVVASEDDPTIALFGMGTAFRDFASRSPNVHRLLFEGLPDGARPAAEASRASIAPVLAACGRLVGPDHALEAARALTAFVHGFASMERAGAFGMGGDVDRAFRYGLALILAGLRDGEPRPAP